MRENNRLGLHEEILLLGLRDRKGTDAGGVWMNYALGGAILAELILENRLRVDVEGKKKFARVTSPRRMRDPVLGECLDKVREAKRRATLETWVARFAAVKKLKEQVAEGLCHTGILRADEDKVLLIFSRKIYPEVDPKPEREIIERLRQAIFTQTRKIDARTSILVSLADSSSILPVVFDKKQLKKRQERIEEIRSGDLTQGATKSAIQAAQTVLMMVAIMPAIHSAAVR
jgi:Golgi phosphoprotein 3